MIRRSLSDQRMIEELTKGREHVLADASPHGLLSVLRTKVQSVTQNIYVFRWIPEQGEDLYDVLLDGATVVHIEVPRNVPSDASVFETWTVDEYLKGPNSLGKLARRKLQLALQLARDEELGCKD